MKIDESFLWWNIISYFIVSKNIELLQRVYKNIIRDCILISNTLQLFIQINLKAIDI